MNPKYNTICIQIVNYLSKYFSSANGFRPSSGRRQNPRDPAGVLLCVMPCRNPDPRHPICSPRPDPNDLSTSEDHPESLLGEEGSSVVLCYV